jgi:hypothetical protein
VETKTVAIESMRRHLGRMLRSEDPVLVTRYGKLVGVFYPLPEPKKVAARFEPQPKTRKRADKQLPLLKSSD